jgi:hypothetical protein
MGPAPSAPAAAAAAACAAVGEPLPPASEAARDAARVMRRSADARADAAAAAAAAAAARPPLPVRCAWGGGCSGMACALLLAERVRRRCGCWSDPPAAQFGLGTQEACVCR